MRELTAAAFVAELGCPMAELEGVLAGTLPVTPGLAASLERVWGVEAAFWLRLQAQHDQAGQRGHG